MKRGSSTLPSTSSRKKRKEQTAVQGVVEFDTPKDAKGFMSLMNIIAEDLHEEPLAIEWADNPKAIATTKSTQQKAAYDNDLALMQDLVYVCACVCM